MGAKLPPLRESMVRLLAILATRCPRGLSVDGALVACVRDKGHDGQHEAPHGHVWYGWKA